MCHSRKRRRVHDSGEHARLDRDNDYTCPFCGGPLDFSHLSGVRGALAEGQDVSARGGELVYVDLCGVPVPAIVAGRRSPVTREGFQVLFLLCSNECAKAVCLASALEHLLSDREPRTTTPNAVFGLRLTTRTAEVGPQFEKAMEFLLPMLTEMAPGAAERFAKTLGSDVIGTPPCVSPRPTRTGRERTQMLMSTRCAWCLCAIPDDAPVTALYVTLQGDDERPAPEGAIVMIGVGGRRHVPVLGSLASATGEGAFMVCSDACANALATDIDEGRRLSVIH